MDLPAYLRIQARANRLANHRLHEAMRTLSRDDFHAPRTSFFPSLAQTLKIGRASWRERVCLAV